MAACSTTCPWSNEPLASQEAVRYDGLAQLFDASRLPDVLVVANFSGGGSRAAAFAHAVLSELDAVPFVRRGHETTLAREIDMVTGVSGGSVAAAHLALHGAREHLARLGELGKQRQSADRPERRGARHRGRAERDVYGGRGRFSKETSLVFSDAVEQWRQELCADPAGLQKRWPTSFPSRSS
jgi:predicted acylesterase/phospholipase RssA